MQPEIIDCLKRALAEDIGLDIGPGDATTNSIVPVDATLAIECRVSRGNIAFSGDGQGNPRVRSRARRAPG